MKFFAAVLAIAAATTPAPHKKPVPNIPPTTKLPHVLYSLRYIDLKIGTGPLAGPHQFYTVNYTGWLKDGTKFDSSFDHSPAAPITFPQGAGRLIPGWDTGFGGMRVGGKRRLIIPYQLAYGELGRPPVIPEKADLIFDIELVSVSDTPPAPPAPPTPPATPAPQAAPAPPPAPQAAPADPAAPSEPATPPPGSETKPPHPEAQ